MTVIPQPLSSTDDAVRMIKLGPGLTVPVDRLNPELRRRWDIAQAKRANGEDMRRTIQTILDEAKVSLGPELMLRAAHIAGKRSLVMGSE
jgi:hypothetical protein